MSRPQKEGIPYFEWDTELDIAHKQILAEYGFKGLGIVVMIYSLIYKGHGYYVEWNDENLLLFMLENGVSGDRQRNLIQCVVSACIKRDIFSQQLYQEYGILTSEKIQENYFRATARRKLPEVEKEYLLLSDANKEVSVCNNSKNVCNNLKNACNNPTDKIREDNTLISKDISCSDDAIQHIFDAWNSLKDLGIPPIIKIAKKSNRYKALSARLKEYSEEDVLKAIEKVKNSDFLQGHNDRNWIIKFDWLLKPNNFIKVLEGNYDNKKNSTLSGWQPTWQPEMKSSNEWQ